MRRRKNWMNFCKQWIVLCCSKIDNLYTKINITPQYITLQKICYLYCNINLKGKTTVVINIKQSFYSLYNKVGKGSDKIRNV